jgi:hypothetical protein
VNPEELMPERREPTLPTPVAASIGLAATVADGALAAVRAAPARLGQLPFACVSVVLVQGLKAKETYDALAARGEDAFARLRGSGARPAGGDPTDPGDPGDPGGFGDTADPADFGDPIDASGASEWAARTARWRTGGTAWADPDRENPPPPTPTRPSTPTGPSVQARTAARATARTAQARPAAGASASADGTSGLPATAGAAGTSGSRPAGTSDVTTRPAAARARTAAETPAAPAAPAAKDTAAPAGRDRAAPAADGKPAPAAKDKPAPKDRAAGEAGTSPATSPFATAGNAEAHTDEAPRTEPLTPTLLPADPTTQAAGTGPDRDELPLPDFDHMTLGSLRGRLRTLDRAALETLRDYERTHANRLPILTMLENRIAKMPPPGSPS